MHPKEMIMTARNKLIKWLNLKELNDEVEINQYLRKKFEYPRSLKEKMDNYGRNSILLDNLFQWVISISNPSKRTKIIHPFIILLVYPLLDSNNLVHMVVDYKNNVIELRSKDKNFEIKKFTREAFKIIVNLLLNETFEKYFPEEFEYLINQGISIEDAESNFIDISFSVKNKTKTILTIVDSINDIEFEKEKNYTTLIKEGVLPIFYYIDYASVSTTINDIHNNIAFNLAKENTLDAVKYYSIIINNNLASIVDFVIDNQKNFFDQNDGCPIKFISNKMKAYGFGKFKRWILQKYIDGEIDSEFFFGKAPKKNIDYKEIGEYKLSETGLDMVLMTFRKIDDEFPSANDFKKLYSQFKQDYVKTLKLFLSDDRKTRMLKAFLAEFHTQVQDLKQINKKIITDFNSEMKEIKGIHLSIYRTVEKLINNDYLDNSIMKLKLHPSCWLLKEDKGNIIKTDIFNKVAPIKYSEFGEDKENIIDYNFIGDKERDIIFGMLEKNLMN